MVMKQNEERLLLNQNPDGLLYLTFLRQSGFFFFLCKYSITGYAQAKTKACLKFTRIVFCAGFFCFELVSNY